MTTKDKVKWAQQEQSQRKRWKESVELLMLAIMLKC